MSALSEGSSGVAADGFSDIMGLRSQVVIRGVMEVNGNGVW